MAATSQNVPKFIHPSFSYIGMIKAARHVLSKTANPEPEQVRAHKRLNLAFRHAFRAGIARGVLDNAMRKGRASGRISVSKVATKKAIKLRNSSYKEALMGRKASPARKLKLGMRPAAKMASPTKKIKKPKMVSSFQKARTLSVPSAKTLSAKTPLKSLSTPMRRMSVSTPRSMKRAMPRMLNQPKK